MNCRLLWIKDPNLIHIPMFFSFNCPFFLHFDYVLYQALTFIYLFIIIFFMVHHEKLHSAIKIFFLPLSLFLSKSYMHKENRSLKLSLHFFCCTNAFREIFFFSLLSYIIENAPKTLLHVWCDIK